MWFIFCFSFAGSVAKFLCSLRYMAPIIRKHGIAYLSLALNLSLAAGEENLVRILTRRRPSIDDFRQRSHETNQSWTTIP